MRRVLQFFPVFMISIQAIARDIVLASPDKNIQVHIIAEKSIQYSISFKDETILLPSPVSITLSTGTIIGHNGTIQKITNRSVDQQIRPTYGISSSVHEQFNEVSIQFRQGYSLVFRAYNEGIAYRFVTNLPGPIFVSAEQSDFHFADNYDAYFHPALSESNYRFQKISEIKEPNYSSLPLLLKTKTGLNILVHESDVLGYPCMSVSTDAVQKNTLKGKHAAYPKKVEPGGHMKFNLIVKETENYIAKTEGKRSFPWRLIAFEEHDRDILTNQIVYLLASENKIGDLSWIKPGKVAWDWWNALNLTGVSFKTGFNTETYKYFIDFAAANNIEYINLDEGWSDQFDLLKITDKLDMNELVRYAKEKKVGIILWCVWRTLDQQMLPAMELFEKWGIAGLKVDFMDRDDQVVVEFHERLLKEAAKRKMLVNYHGAYHPTGMQRTYPNNINVEGVRGLEWNKFDPEGASPLNAVTIPFIRMFAGSMDYTPGAMQNYNKVDWKQIFDRPMSQGTICQQLAMYVVYYAPLQMLSDAPTAYEREPNILHDFLADVPTTWDETIPLESSVASSVNVARRKGNTWYAGGMTNWDGKQVTIKLDFLEEGKEYIATLFTDGPNAARVGNDYIFEKLKVRKGNVWTIEMAPGGGWAARFVRTN